MDTVAATSGDAIPTQGRQHHRTVLVRQPVIWRAEGRCHQAGALRIAHRVLIRALRCHHEPSPDLTAEIGFLRYLILATYCVARVSFFI
jgi:hypothetical protein